MPARRRGLRGRKEREIKESETNKEL